MDLAKKNLFFTKKTSEVCSQKSVDSARKNITLNMARSWALAGAIVVILQMTSANARDPVDPVPNFGKFLAKSHGL